MCSKRDMPLLKAKAKKNNKSENNIAHKTQYGLKQPISAYVAFYALPTQKSGGSELNRAAALFIIFKKSTISAQK